MIPRKPPTMLPGAQAPVLRLRTLLFAFAVSLVVGGCGSDRFAKRTPKWADTLQSASDPVTVTPKVRAEDIAEQVPEESTSTPDADFYRPGNDVLVRKVSGIANARQQTNGDVKLNFQNANLLEVVKIILGDTLGINYAVDPSVQGTVSMQTTRALRHEDLIPTLELLLRMNNAALIAAEGNYRVVPLATALAEVRAPQLGDSGLALPIGFNVRVVPLKYVAAEEMAQILNPFMAGSNQLLRVDSQRNLLVMASAGADMDRLLETIDVFDVDRMAGMSVALFTPDFVDAATLAEDLDKLLADPQMGLMPGLVRFIVIERINGLMVVTPRAEHLAQVREWVNRLDRNSGDAAPRLFVYRVQNGKATDLATILGGLFGESSSQSDDVSLAPGLKPATIGETASPDSRDSTNQDVSSAPPAATSFSPPSSIAGGSGLSIDQSQNVRIIADEPNNALLILARGSDYRQILTALRQLDVSPMQVLIEVTIAEVTLTDNLSFGVEWFFKNGVGQLNAEGLLDLGASGVGPLTPGFSYAISGSDDVVRAVLNTLASESNLSIISSPSLLVLNNREASIQVGEEVPITTQQQQSTDVNANILNSIEYRDTGILLTVKPRINSGGLVIMEVEQEASQVPTTNNADPLTPRIRKRTISSTVAVNSGDTIILGGLIQDNRDTSESGLPVLHKVPILGSLFGTKADNQARTELIVMITPRAVSNGTAALQVTEEYRQRLKKLIPSKSDIKRAGSPVPLSGGPRSPNVSAQSHQDRRGAARDTIVPPDAAPAPALPHDG